MSNSVLGFIPYTGAFFARQPHALQTLQAADQQHALMPLRRIAGGLIDMIQAVSRFALQCPVQTGPTFLIDFPQ